MPCRECVAFLLIASGKILLEKRSMQKKSDPGLMAIPGGHIEEGESREQALIREMEEELCVRPENYWYLCSRHHPAEKLQLIHYYVVSRWSGELIAREADEIAWHPVPQAPIDIEVDQSALSEYLRIGATQKVTF